MSICLNRVPPIKIKKNRFATEAEEEEEEAKNAEIMSFRWNDTIYTMKFPLFNSEHDGRFVRRFNAINTHIQHIQINVILIRLVTVTKLLLIPNI